MKTKEGKSHWTCTLKTTYPNGETKITEDRFVSFDGKARMDEICWKYNHSKLAKGAWMEYTDLRNLDEE